MPRRGDLEAYRGKRTPGRTPEPFGEAGESGGPLRFVVQQHAARRLHWDLRLEWGGALLSWAVPKGPSYDPRDKQLAVQTEDHPLEYADFEGVIPKGEYGGGAMIVWDRGQWLPLEDPTAGLASGKLLFELRGYKLRGTWTLVKLKKEPRSWLLIKERDAWARAAPPNAGETAGLDPRSVFSGLTVEELAAGGQRAAELRRAARKLGAPERRVEVEDAKPMLAETTGRPFSRRGWVFELKYDGFRVLAAKGALIYRSGQHATRLFPEVARAVSALPVADCILDGEVVVLEESGRPSFQRLQKRAQLQRAGDIERGTLEHPATYFAFDLLACEGLDLRPLPLVERKRLLRALLPAAGPLRYADHVEERGEALFAEVQRLGVEGIVGKRADSLYAAGRSAHWQKVRADHEEDLVVVGYTQPKGSRAALGALLLAGYDGDRLVYAGRVGTGFSDAQLGAIAARLDQRRRASPPCSEAPAGKEHVWTEPALVAVVRFKERTDDGQLRQPVFVRLRDDKKPEDCPLPLIAAAGNGIVAAAVSGRRSGGRARRPAPTTTLTPPRAAEKKPRPRLQLSNLDKVFWPDEGYTKGDLLDYYRAISPWLLPYLRQRPLVLDRYPDGIRGKHFYQKDSPVGTPDWVRTAALWSDDSSREIDYFICDDVETLLHIINLGTIPLHVWASRLSSRERPDWSILDLDPKEATFRDVVKVAGAVRELCDEIGLPAFPKTSGSTGLHVLLPLGGQLDFAQARQLAELLARAVAA
ncbi:MAG TPA: DNA ligase D, partial [Thermoanaerobaculia bacterium]|nr:DNA ligase D [Thermoanaerobaculia bacterium]